VFLIFKSEDLVLSERKTLLETVDEMREEIVELTAEFVKIPTVNPPGENYPKFTDFYAKRAEELGLDVQVIRIPKERVEEMGYTLPRTNAVATLKGEKDKPVLHMNGHFDVVPTGSEWTVDPFGAEIREGMMYGRGSSDMKGSVAAQLMAAAAIRKAGIKLKGSIAISATCDEETGGQLGAGYIVEGGYADADLGINSDSGPIDAVSLGHRGALWLEITTKGKASHGSVPHKGINAVEKMADVIQELKELREGFKKTVSAMPLADPLCKHPTLTIGGTIHGGIKTNVVPDRCVMTVDRRVIYEETPEEAREEIEAALRIMAGRDPEFSYETRVVNRIEPSYTPESSDVVKALKNNVKAILGKEAKISYGGGYTDMWYFNKIMPMAHYGVNLSGQAHTADEHLKLDDLITGTKIIALTAVDLLI
jgi:succinyl-diaminopimelate desuccinylase